MKKFRLLPSILMLVLCTAVLAVGIYAASPTSHSIVGTVNITAGGANVSITAYIDDGDGVSTNDVQASTTYTSRTSQTINLYANVLDFDCSSASDIKEVAEKKLYFKVENHSSFSLGAYFLEGTVPSGGTTASNIAESKNFNGTMGTTTIPNLITATFTTYSEVPVNGSTNMYSTLKLNQLNTEESTVTLSLNLNIEKFNEELAPASENSVQVKKSSATNVSIDCELQNASTTSTKSISTSGVWETGALAFSDETFGGQLRLQTIKLSMNVTNNGEVPISVTLSAGDLNVAQDSSKVDVTILDNPYIGVGKTGEVSVQFSVIYDRANETLTVPTLNTYNYNLIISQVTEVTDAEVLSRVKYDSDTTTNSMPTKGFKYYIEFGDNPYYTSGSTTHREKLRWYIWGKDNGSGVATTLVAGTDYNASTNAFIGGGTYYFISEYSLDLSNSGQGISFQNEYNNSDSYNYYGGEPADYAASNFRNYLNGITIKSSNVGEDIYLPNGDNFNFYERYNFTGDSLFGFIKARDISELYSVAGNSDLFDSKFNGQADKFWSLSYNELDCLVGTTFGTSNKNAIAYLLSGGTGNSVYHAKNWLLRTKGGRIVMGGVDYQGSTACTNFLYSDTKQVRPAFALAI